MTVESESGLNFFTLRSFYSDSKLRLTVRLKIALEMKNHFKKICDLETADCIPYLASRIIPSISARFHNGQSN